MTRRTTLLFLAAAVLVGAGWLVFSALAAEREAVTAPVRAAAASAAAKGDETSSNRTVVLELFTSQGCSSCPPADRLLTALGEESFRNGTVIPLAWHVDYWNHIGWSDPFSSPEWSRRQHEYAQAMNATQVYTPQLVLNGGTQLVGSFESAVRTEISRQLGKKPRGQVTIESFALSDGIAKASARATVPEDVDPATVALQLVLFENDITTAVRRGENSGRTLRNDHIVRWSSGHLELPSAAGRQIDIPLSEAWKPKDLGLAVFIQEKGSLEILAAAVKNPSDRR